MKKILSVVVLTLAMNFVLAAGGLGWLAASGHLTRQRMGDVRRTLFPPLPATQPTTAPATQPVVDLGPDARLESLLAKAQGRPAVERVEYVQQGLDIQIAALDRRRRELLDLQRQVTLAEAQTAADRAAVDRDRKALAGQEGEQAKLATDKGFQDALHLYQTLPSKQVKQLFMTLPDDTVVQYLQAMEPRQAGKVMKEFKTPAEVDRVQRVLERIHRPTPAVSPIAPAAPTAAAPTDPAAGDLPAAP